MLSRTYRIKQTVQNSKWFGESRDSSLERRHQIRAFKVKESLAAELEEHWDIPEIYRSTLYKKPPFSCELFCAWLKSRIAIYRYQTIPYIHPMETENTQLQIILLVDLGMLDWYRIVFHTRMFQHFCPLLRINSIYVNHLPRKYPVRLKKYCLN